MHVNCKIKTFMYNTKDRVHVLQIKTYRLTKALNFVWTFLCKEQKNTTTLSLGQITTSCQCCLHWRALN